MATRISEKNGFVTNEEFEYINEQSSHMEVNSDHKTSIKCPRCGKPLYCIDSKSSYSIYCEDETCIKLNFRGI